MSTITYVRHLATDKLGILARVDGAGHPVIRMVGAVSERPYRWDQFEVLGRVWDELTIPGGFAIGLHVDGHGDLWREQSLGLFSLVAVNGRHVRGGDLATVSEVEDMTGGLFPAGSPEAEACHRANCSEDRDYLSALVMVGVTVVLACAVFVILAVILRSVML